MALILDPTNIHHSMSLAMHEPKLENAIRKKYDRKNNKIYYIFFFPLMDVRAIFGLFLFFRLLLSDKTFVCVCGIFGQTTNI